MPTWRWCGWSRGIPRAIVVGPPGTCAGISWLRQHCARQLDGAFGFHFRRFPPPALPTTLMLPVNLTTFYAFQASEGASDHGRAFLASHASSDKAHLQYTLDAAIGASHAFDVSGKDHNCVLRTAHMGLLAFTDLGYLGDHNLLPECLRSGS
jgi:hypothetical protein